MRVLIADDSLLLREGLVRLLNELGHEVVAEVADADRIVLEAVRTSPEVAIIDVRMPPTFTDDGIRAAIAVRREVPGTAVLILSQYVEVSYTEELLSTGDGSVGYLLKDRVSDIDVLERALATVAGGGTVLDPSVVTRLLRRRGARDPIAELSPRERQVLELMAQGMSNTAIQQELVLSAGAVEKYVGRIFTKLDLPPSAEDNRRVRAVLVWLQRG